MRAAYEADPFQPLPDLDYASLSLSFLIATAFSMVSFHSEMGSLASTAAAWLTEVDMVYRSRVTSRCGWF
jgi:hypothetical protein